MKTLRIRYTRGDYCTQPGGFILRERDDGEFVVHTFNRQYGSKEPNEYYWGRYHHNLADAQEAFNEKVSKAKQFTTGGSLIDEADVDHEISVEFTPEEMQ